MELDTDRLILELPGLSEVEARRLAWLVAEALGSMDAPGADSAMDRLRVRVSLHPGDGLASTAQRIARDVCAALTRSSS
jgi:hypothetical protein